MTEWKDISTAPKDGTEILGYREDAGCMLIRWTAPYEFLTDSELDSYGVGLDEGWQEVEGWFYADFIHGDRLEEAPTHWMELPPAPQEE